MFSPLSGMEFDFRIQEAGGGAEGLQQKGIAPGLIAVSLRRL